MVCTHCGFATDEGRFCPQCGKPFGGVGSTDSSSSDKSNKPGTAPHRPPTPPPPPPTRRGADQSRSLQGQPSMDTADRLVATGKVVGLSGCLLALVFWVLIPVGFLLFATAFSSSTGFAIVALSLGLIIALIWWVYQRTGQ